jgi:hypothetical protein
MFAAVGVRQLGLGFCGNGANDLALIWRAFAPWEGSATQILLQPFTLNTHATAAPVGAASMSHANGACIVECKSCWMGGLRAGQRCGHPEHRHSGHGHHHSTR